MHVQVAVSPALAHWRSASRAEIDHLVDAYHVVRAIGPAGARPADTGDHRTIPVG